MRARSPKPEHDEQKQKKMILSSRASPPKALKLVSKKTSTDRYLSIKHLLPSTPIPSPSLPSILPRHGKKPPKLNSRKIVRCILWLSILIGAYYVVSFGRRKSHELVDLTFLSSSSGKTYEIVEASELPDYPTPLALTDSKGKHHWTISIPSTLNFPLAPAEYADICSHADEVAKHAAGGQVKADQDYYHEDPNFIDVGDAQAQNFLPPVSLTSKLSTAESSNLPICEKSLTYVLDATDAGLGSALLGMWLSYGLAQRESRAFFVDDTQFPYGNFSTFFTSQATPACRQPHPSQRVPCPHQANHLVVSSSTIPWTFGSEFHSHFSQGEIFTMAREGYKALFHLRPEDTTYVTKRADKLRKSTNSRPNNPITLSASDDLESEPLTGLIGIHIRRGDRHPFSLEYSRNYIPPSTYISTAKNLIGKASPEHWRFLLASDDPDMYDAEATHMAETQPMGITRAQERISLASKKALARHSAGVSADDGKKSTKKGSSDALGWEGGFFKDVFWNLGLSEDEKWHARKMGSPMPHKEKGRYGEKDEDGRERRVHHHDGHGHANRKSKGAGQKSTPNALDDGRQIDSNSGSEGEMVRDYRSNPTKESLQLRELLGRAYLLDLAVLAQSDKIVCGVSANACRILAVMLGWERAFEKGDWVNVDGGYGWRVMDY